MAMQCIHNLKHIIFIRRIGYDERIPDPGYSISHDEYKNTNPCRVDPIYFHYSISTFEHHSIQNHTNHDIVLGKNADDITTTTAPSIQTGHKDDDRDNSVYVPHYPKQ
jgi:hypothetical protein